MGASSKSAHARRPSISRAPGCTHTSFCRKFTTSQDEVCDLCHRRPSFGWLYHCSQDFGGSLPAAEGKLLLPRFESDAQLYTLSNSIVSAAQNGHYTDGQLSTLWKQKSRVRDIVQKARPYSPSSTSSSTTSSRRSLKTSSTFSTVHSFDSDTDSELDLGHLSDQPFTGRTVLEPIQEVSDEAPEEGFEPLNILEAALIQYRIALCYHKVCHSCRPSYRDRSFQSIDQVVCSSMLPPPHEWQNRRLSLASLLQDLNYTPTHEMSDTDSNSEIEGASSILEGVTSNSMSANGCIKKMPLRSLHQTSTYHNLAALAALSNTSTLTKEAVNSIAESKRLMIQQPSI